MAERQREQRRLEEYEEELLRKHAQQQQQRQDELDGLKAQAEAQRDLIFRRLCEEEAERRAQAEFLENLRNELSLHEANQRASRAEQNEKEKRDRQKAELQAAAEYDKQLKIEREA